MSLKIIRYIKIHQYHLCNRSKQTILRSNWRTWTLLQKEWNSKLRMIICIKFQNNIAGVCFLLTSTQFIFRGHQIHEITLSILIAAIAFTIFLIHCRTITKRMEVKRTMTSNINVAGSVIRLSRSDCSKRKGSLIKPSLHRPQVAARTLELYDWDLELVLPHSS